MNKKKEQTILLTGVALIIVLAIIVSIIFASGLSNLPDAGDAQLTQIEHARDNTD